MIIEIEKRDVVIAQTEDVFRVKHMCRTVFIPESDEDVEIVNKFVEQFVEQLLETEQSSGDLNVRKEG